MSCVRPAFLVQYNIPSWYIIMINYKEKGSQRGISAKLGLSRSTFRKAVHLDDSIKVSSLRTIANFYNRELQIITYPRDHSPSCSAVAVGFYVSRDGFDSWKIHLMNLVDEFRKTNDHRLFVLPPDASCPPEIVALIAGTVLELCRDLGLPAPQWAHDAKPLSKPWFVSGMESLKATALLESPYGFRSKNIFVQRNFLSRI